MQPVQGSDMHTNEQPLLLGIVYFPPEGSTCNVHRDNYFQTLECDIVAYKNQFSIALVGDFNAHTNCELDFIKEVAGQDIPLFTKYINVNISPKLCHNKGYIKIKFNVTNLEKNYLTCVNLEMLD